MPKWPGTLIRDLFNQSPFAIAEPPLKLVLIEGAPGEPTRMDHLGVEVETTDEVAAATARLAAAGLPTATEEDAACCYAVQDKVWVTAPGDEPWEVYVVKGDANVLDKAPDAACCAPAAGTDAATLPAGAGCC
jgi:Glyoxalase/Bleomycin resistance protein/Dioxygenase superfamily